MTRYIATEKINIDEVVERLFDFTTLGAVSIPEMLTKKGKTELQEAIEQTKHLFFPVERERGPVIQEMKTLYLERLADHSILPIVFRERIATVLREYAEIYSEIAYKANFADHLFNSVGVHHYPIGSAGITPHQDFAADSNLITSFVICGSAPFYVCANREKESSILLDSTPGSVIFMRAARREQEQKARPFHYLVGPMEKERYSILIRTRTKKKMEQLQTEY